MAHAFLRIAGYGLRVLPAVPFAIRTHGSSLELAVPDEEKGEYAVRVDSATERTAHAFGDVFDGPADDVWRLEVGGVYVAQCPTELVLRSWPEPDQPPFFMLGDDAGSVVYVQGPFAAGRAPSLGSMCGAGQRERGRGDHGALRWIDLSYEHRGAEWCQRHVVTPLAAGTAVVVTCQATAEHAPRIMASARDFAATVAPYAE